MRIPFRAFGAAGVVALLVAADLGAQAVPTPPRPGRREIPNLDISPEGAWRTRARQVSQARRAALARRDLRFLNGPQPSAVVDGNFNLPIVFIGYSDTTVTTGVTPVIGDTAQFRDILFSADPQNEAVPRPYSLKTYYEQVSNGRLTMNGQLFGWVNTNFTYDSIGNNCAAVFCAGFQVRFGAMLRAALDSLDGVDWGQFDNNGPDGNPNSGDDDGVVDFITFVHPTVGGECGGPGGGQFGDRIWAHRWTLQSVSGSQYTTTTPRSGGGFIRINDYTVQSARGGSTSCSAGSVMPIGTVAHETGHAFGIPDLYNTDQNNPSEGIGEWGLMGSANYTTPFSPGGFDPWSQLELGWVNADTLSSAGTITLGPVQTGDTVLIVPIATTDEYFILENRAALHSDTAQMVDGFSRRKLPGLLIWHIDQSVIDAGRGTNTVNAGVIEGVRLMQADGLAGLQAGTNRGDTGDSYPGSTVNRVFGPTSGPNSHTNGGVSTGIVIDSIHQISPTGAMIFRFAIDSAPPPAVSYAQATNAILGITPLSGPQATYLDDVGNNNGIYDLGDYLAYLKANAIVAAPGLLKRIESGRGLAPRMEQ